MDEWKKYIELYEDKARKLKLKVPNRPPYDHKTSVQVGQFTDAYIYRHIYNGIIADMYPLVTAYRTSTTNDNIRQIIQDDLVEHLSSFELIYKYGNLKGWIDAPPSYNTFATKKPEQLTSGEAFHILDHVSHRYHQIQLTEFFLSFTHDRDLKDFLSRGAKNLERQVAKLQELALKYEINLPNQHPSSTQVPIGPEAAADDFLYSVILNGVQSVIDLHVRAVIETIRNDAIRSFFFELFIEELQMYERFLKYGKAKGWLMIVPIFSPQS